MNINKRLFGFLVLLSIISPSYADSSKVILPLNPVSGTQQNITVTHVASNVPPNTQATCPVSSQRTSGTWSGASPINNASLVSSQFYPAGWSKNTSGWLVYRCSETYWSLDPHYVDLTTHATTTNCQSSMSWSETCTVSTTNLSGLIPVHFILRNPPQTMVRNDNMGSYNRVGWAKFSGSSGGSAAGAQIVINGSGSPQVSNGELEFSGQYSVGTTINILAQWGIIYSQTDGGGNGFTSNPGLASAYCPNANTTYPLVITNDMLGKTCDISCDTTQWNLVLPFGDNCCSPRRVYVYAPVIISCH